MSRPPKDPAERYSLADAVSAALRIRQLRTEAGDDDLDAGFPGAVADDHDIDAVVQYLEAHRKVSARVRAAELRDRSLLVEYQHQRETARHEQRVFSILHTGHQLGVHPAYYGEPMGLRSRQAVYDRRTRWARKRAIAAEQAPVDEGRVRDWIDEHAAEIRALADMLIDQRDELLELVNGAPAREELARNIDAAGTLMNSRRPSQELCTAVALALNILRPPTARPPQDPAVHEQIAHGLRLLW